MITWSYSYRQQSTKEYRFVRDKRKLVSFIVAKKIEKYEKTNNDSTTFINPPNCFYLIKN